jgi:hypothetical protein
VSLVRMISACILNGQKLASGCCRVFDVMLASDGSGQGRGGSEQKDVLPPLVPGMKARQQQ